MIPLFEMQTRLTYKVDAWVILPDHFHAIMTPSGIDLSSVVQSLKQSFSMNYRKRCCVTGKVWQLRFWDHVIRDKEDMRRHVDYIHYNPVRHGLVDDPSVYALSSATAHPTSVERIVGSTGITIDSGDEYGE
jgi:putative transposase